MDIFVEDDDFRIVILDNKISFRKNDRLKTVYIKNKNLKYYFKSLDNTKKYYINDISILSFKNCSLLFDTYHGTILSVDDEKLFLELEKNYNLEYYDNINDHKFKVMPKAEYLFDNVGNLNSKIKNYGNKMGLDIRSTSTSLRLRVSNMSNDYSYLEYLYKYITNQELLSSASKNINK